jgi:hypothetical protein
MEVLLNYIENFMAFMPKLGFAFLEGFTFYLMAAEWRSP